MPWFLGTILLLAMIIVVEIFVGWNEVLSLWGNISLAMLLLAFGLFAMSHLIRAIRIYVYVTKGMGRRFRTTLKLSLLHQFTNNMLPMRLGEAAYPLLMNRYFGTRWTSSFASLFWLRLLDGIIVVGLLWVIYVIKSRELFWLTALAGLISLMAYWWLVRVRPVALPGWLGKTIAVLRDAAPKSWMELSLLMALTVACWISKLGALALFVTSIQPMPVIIALSGVLGAELSSILPVHGVAGTGSYEAAFVAAVYPHGVRDPSVIANAVNVHIFVLASTSLLALLVLPLKVRLHERFATDQKF